MNKRRIAILALAAVTFRSIFLYFPGTQVEAFFPLAPNVLLSHQQYFYYLGEHVSFMCVWAALGFAVKDLKFEFTVLFFTELLALFDYMLRYGQDIFFVGFDMNTVKIVAFGLSFPVNYLLKTYGGSRIKS